MLEVPGTGKTSSLRVCDVLPGNIGLISDLTLDYLEFLTAEGQPPHKIVIGQNLEGAAALSAAAAATTSSTTSELIEGDDLASVIMDIAPEISTLTGQIIPIFPGVGAPVFAERSAQTRVAVNNGQTIVIGGLIEDRATLTEEKVPLLGDIPYLGNLFKHKKTDKSKTERLIFLTPHVAVESTALPGMSEDEIKGIKIPPNAVTPGAFQEQLEGMRRRATTQPGEPLYVATTAPSDTKGK